jgi:uncharacterized phage protein (TIGR01671 family)
MREIKFRCWHKGYLAQGRMKETLPQMIYDEKSGDCLVWLSQGQPTEIMQYTGLKDKNGKEIYECDILKHEMHWWDHRIISVATMDYPFYCGDFSVDNDDCEVIGNIYENPEKAKP